MAALEAGNHYPVGISSRRAWFDGLFRMDLSDIDGLARILWRVRLRTVFLAAAMTDVEACERDPALAERINTLAPRLIARACAAEGARLIYFSTDAVFDGTRPCVTEEDTPNPLSVFGRTKLEGERAVQAALPSALILRTCANFGWNRLEPRENFVTGILNRLRRGETVSLRTDRWVSPSYAPVVANVAYLLMNDLQGGLYHVACRPCLSEYDVGREICKVFDLPEEQLRETTIDEVPGAARRPARSCLLPDKLETRFHSQMPSFHDWLVDMKNREGESPVDWDGRTEGPEFNALAKYLVRTTRVLRLFAQESTGIKARRRRRRALQS
jgi:dTDP-4-dehydrorhamnose reductase